MMMPSKENIYVPGDRANTYKKVNYEMEFDAEEAELSTTYVNDKDTTTYFVKSEPTKQNFLEPLCRCKDTDADLLQLQPSIEDIPKSDFKYGWSLVTSKFLQKFNKPIFFLLVLCLAGLAQGLLITGVSFTVITSIEKQFGLKSTEAGLFGTVYDIAFGVCCLFAGYIGHKHKPRFIGWGLLLLSIGAVAFTIPKYLIGPYEAGVERDEDFCSIGNLQNLQHCKKTSEWVYNAFFFLAQILMGVGATPLYTLGPAHIDEITTRGDGSLYLGIFYAAAALGPGIGFVIGLPILNTWVDINQPPNSSLSPNDGNWVGAWWIGYLVGAALLLLPVVPMLGFPKLFPNEKKIKSEKLEYDDTIEENKDLRHDLGSLPPAVKGLLCNAPYMFICLSSAAESLTIGGFSTFLPKFVQTQFHVTSSDAAFYTGLIVIPGAVGGIFLGGFLVKKWNWNCKQILKGASVMAFIATTCVCCALIGCEGRTVTSSADHNQKRAVAEASLNQTCNSNCMCSSHFYKPICSVKNQQTFFSPCHAGCSKGNLINGTYRNCSCFATEDSYAEDGRCTPDCSMFPLFAFATFALIFCTFMNNVPMLSATFRVVPEGQGSFAMGFQEIFVRFLGFIPAPVMFGSLIDQSCQLWQKDDCTGDTTSCVEYDNTYFRYYIFSLGIITKFLSFFFVYMAYRWYQLPAPKNVGSKERLTNGNIYQTNIVDDSSSSGQPSPTNV